MGATTTDHPTDKILRAYGLGQLDDTASESVAGHLEACADCRRRVAELTSDSFLGRLRDAHGQPGPTGPLVSSLSGLSMLEDGGSPKAPPATDTLPPGLAGHPDFEVLRELGQGGMGTVYLAFNRLMGRHEVLKVVSRHLIGRSGAPDRFLGEIRNAARLHHTNIVTAYSAMRLGESVMFAMEYVAGLDLSRLVKAKGPLAVPNACNYIHQAALGLQHAHELGMVHRDIKPSNLMLASQGNRAVIKVLDFGLAKVKSEGAVDGGLTHEGQMLGTPDYIAPEQISDARGADIRADIYSLGCTLYYLLTGGAPFHADNLYEILQAHHSMDAPPLNLARPEVPVELAALVAKMMAKEPRRRFQAPKEVAQALQPFFKKGVATARGPIAEMSRLGEADGDRASTGVRQTPTTPAPATPSPSAPPREAASDTPRTEPDWGRLIELKKADVSEGPARAGPGPAPRSRWIRPSVAAGLLVLGVIVAWAVIIRITTANGVIVVENVPERAVLEVDGERITFSPAAGKTVDVEVRAGKHVVIVKRGEEFFLDVGVTVETGKTSTLVVRIEPRAAPPAEAKAATEVEGDEVGHMGAAARKDEQTVLEEDKDRSEVGPPGRTGLPEGLSKDAGESTRAAKAGDRAGAVREARAHPKTETIENSIGMRLNLIPAGEFPMGSPTEAEDAPLDEKPRRIVRISPFYLGVTEVTQAQYKAVMMGDNPSHFSSTGKGKDKVAGRSTDQFPVECVRWLDAVRFCDALSKKEGRLPAYEKDETAKTRTVGGPGYRLPTEAEWEYACRAGTATNYSYGDNASLLNRYAWFGRSAKGMTHPVGEKLPNAFGLYDMHGNVRELCSDWFDDAYYRHAPPNDPQGPAVGVVRAARGGTWRDRAPLLRSANRSHAGVAFRGDGLGFRVALGQAGR